MIRRSDLAGFDQRGRLVQRIQASVLLWLLDGLLAFGAEDEDLVEDDPADDDEQTNRQDIRAISLSP